MAISVVSRNSYGQKWPNKVWLTSKLVFPSILIAYVIVNDGQNKVEVDRGGGFRDDYVNVIFALSNAEYDYGRGEGV